MKNSILSKMFVYAALSFFAASCGSSQNIEEKRDLDYYIANAIELKGEPLQTEYITSSPSFNCYYTPMGFFGTMKNENEKIVHLADLQTGEVKASALAKGRGPDEILITNPSTDIFNGELYLLDIMSEKIMKAGISDGDITIENVMKLNSKQPMFFVNMQAINDSLFVIFASNTAPRRSILLIDKNNNILDSLAYYPYEDEKINQTSMNFNVEMRLSPDKKHLFISCNQYDCISKYEIQENKIVPIKKMFFIEPKYTVKDGRPVRPENYVYFNSSIRAGEKYIYVTIDPESIKEYRERQKKADGSGARKWAQPCNDNYILVFDYDLKLVQSYLTQSNIFDFTLTPDPSVLYASDSRESRLVKYKLPL